MTIFKYSSILEFPTFIHHVTLRKLKLYFKYFRKALQTSYDPSSYRCSVLKLYQENKKASNLRISSFVRPFKKVMVNLYIWFHSRIIPQKIPRSQAKKKEKIEPKMMHLHFRYHSKCDT